MQKKGKFDYILLETTGLADPGPIAAMFWLDDELGCDIYLDGQTNYITIATQSCPIAAMFWLGKLSFDHNHKTMSHTL